MAEHSSPSAGKGPVADPAARTSWATVAGALGVAATAPALVAAGVLVAGAVSVSCCPRIEKEQRGTVGHTGVVQVAAVPQRRKLRTQHASPAPSQTSDAQAAQTIIYAVQRWRWRHVPTARGGSHWLLGSMPAVVKAGGSHLALERWCREHKNQPFKVASGLVVLQQGCTPDRDFLPPPTPSSPPLPSLVPQVLLIGRVIVVLPHPDHARQVLMRCTNRMQLINPSFILQRGVQRALDDSMVLQAR